MRQHLPSQRHTAAVVTLSLPTGKVEKYTDGKWQVVAPHDQVKMTQQDGQLWIAMLNLLLKPECQGKYDYNNFNKSQLHKVSCLTPQTQWTSDLDWPIKGHYVNTF